MAAAKIAVRRKAEEALQHAAQGHDHPGHDHEAEQTMHVGAADDAYEVAADKAADAAVRRLAEGGSLGESSAGFAPATPSPGAIGAAGGSAGGETSARIAKARGGGAALPSATRASMESAFGGADFSGVRLHQGKEAASLSSAVGAHAFTVGKDVFLGGSMPDLASREGQHTLAHELAHTLQPAGGVHRFSFGSIFSSKDKKKKSHTDEVSKSLTGEEKEAAEGKETSETIEGVAGVNDSVGETLGQPGEYNEGQVNHLRAQGVSKDDAEKNATKMGNDSSTTGLDSTGMVLGGVGAVFAVAKLIKAWKANDKESKLDNAQNVLGAVGSITSTGKGAAGVGKDAIDAGAKGSSEAAEAASNILGEITGIISVIKDGFSIVKQIGDAIRDKDSMDDTEKGSKALEIVKTILSAGKNVVSTINTFLSHLATPSQAMLSAVPGLGIAMGVLDFVTTGISTGTAYVSWKEMRAAKREKKGGLRERALVKFRQELTEKNKTAAKKLTDKEIEEQAQAKFGKDTTKSSGIRGFFGGHKSGKEYTEYLKDPSSTGPDKDSEDYDLNKSLQEIGAKRIRRGALNIVSTAAGIAGDIATLTGVGAAVGTGLKAAGGGLKALSAGFRMAKQAVRDRAAKSSSDLVKKIFVHGKTSEEKDQMYNSMVDKMVDHVQAADGKPAEMKKVAAEVEASGYSELKMKAVVNGKGNEEEKGKKLYKDWVSALKQRG